MNDATDIDNRYQYNGKELNNDHGLGWYNYGARFYDAVLGRFTTVDRFAEKYTAFSPLSYAANNPILNIDVNGDSIFINNIGNITRNDKTDNLVFLQGKGGTLKQLGELGKLIDANEIYSNLLAKNVKEAEGMISPFAFRDKVKNKGDWDLKNDKNSIFGLGNDGKTKFSFQGESLESQDLGNHHFGAVAKAYGLFPSEEFILKQAGAAQMAAGTSRPEWQKYEEYKVSTRGGYVTTQKRMLPPYGDDPRDQHFINSGFNFYKNYKKRK